MAFNSGQTLGKTNHINLLYYKHLYAFTLLVAFWLNKLITPLIEFVFDLLDRTNWTVNRIYSNNLLQQGAQKFDLF